MEEKRIEEKQECYQTQYVILTQQILNDDRLTPTAKLVLARASGFSLFFEACQNTADFLGVSTQAVRTAREKLVELGYFEEYQNTGRGKSYLVHLTPCVKNESAKKQHSDLQKIALRPTKNSTQSAKKQQHNINININENKTNINNNDAVVVVADGANVAQAPKQYGNPDVNRIMEVFEQAVGIPTPTDKKTRYCAYRLIKKYGAENVVQVIGVLAESLSDPYAPRIATLSDLEHKWANLYMWRLKTQQSANQGGNIAI